MNKSNFLKSASTFAFAAGLFVNAASADHRKDNVGSTIWKIERSTNALAECFRHELQDRGLWKPRGAYAVLFKRVATLENQGDNLLKYYKRGKGYAYLAKAVAITDANAHEAADLARHLRVSRVTVNGINKVNAMLHSLKGLCGNNYRAPRAHHYEQRRGHYDYGRRGRVYDERRYRREAPIRHAYREIRWIF
jgi:hypothetical protein